MVTPGCSDDTEVTMHDTDTWDYGATSGVPSLTFFLGIALQHRLAPQKNVKGGNLGPSPSVQAVESTKQAAGAPSAWSQPSQSLPSDHADGATLG